MRVDLSLKFLLIRVNHNLKALKVSARNHLEITIRYQVPMLKTPFAFLVDFERKSRNMARVQFSRHSDLSHRDNLLQNLSGQVIFSATRDHLGSSLSLCSICCSLTFALYMLQLFCRFRGSGKFTQCALWQNYQRSS